MIKIAIFVERDFDRVVEWPTATEARAYAQGLQAGAGEYSGSLQAYVIGEDDGEMAESQKVKELARCYAALKELS